MVFNEENLFRDIESEKIEVSTVTKNKPKKKITFSDDLVETLRNKILVGESSNQGGATEDTDREQAQEEESILSEEDDTGNETQTLDNYLLARDRGKRESRPPSRYEDTDYATYALASADSINFDEPKSYVEAMRCKSSRMWGLGMDDEMDSLNRNQTWILTDRPKDQKVIGCKWVYKLKPGATEIEQPRHKARLVAKGFAQVEGIDYNEVFAPVVKHVSIRLLLLAVVNQDMELEQVDVKTAFLHGVLHETIYMNKPEGYVQKSKEDKVWLLKKSLYRLKQSPREWNHRFDSFMVSQKYKRSEYDPCVYLKGSTIDDMVYLLLYVDDMLIASKDIKVIKSLRMF